MPRKRLSMRKIKEVLRLKCECCLSHSQIATSCQIGMGTVWEYLRRAREAGLSWPLPDELDDARLEALLYPPLNSLPDCGRPLPDWTEVHRELRRKGVTLLLLWEEYRALHAGGYGYSRFCELYQSWSKTIDPRMRQVHKAGEKLFVDYAGQTMPVVDRKTGEVREAQVFVATLGASSYTYTEATWTQTLPDWTSSHAHAFAFFGGVPETVVPDNLKSGVTSACFYEPDLNPTYLEMARHYGIVILPARVRKPRDKAKVENGVQQIERRVLAPLRNRTFFSLGELNAAMRERLTALNERPSQGLAASRRELFETLDKPALKPLPNEPYEFALWKKARVHIDYHIEIERHWYSVPYRLLKQQVDVRITSTVIECFHNGERVASHQRSSRKSAFTTLAAHMPPEHRKWSEWNPERLLRWARQIGPATREAIEKILASRTHQEQGFRACLGVLRLHKVYGAIQLENACSQALFTGTPSYRSVHAILRRPPEQQSLPLLEPERPPIQHKNLRGPAYYQTV
jgi:transposase